MNREAKESEELRRNDPLEIPVSEECARDFKESKGCLKETL